MKIQLVVILVLGLAATVFAGVRYARLGEAAGVGVYRVTLGATDPGGIFSGAEVTYRGAPVGRVDGLRLTREGVDVDLRLRTAAGRIPESAVAVVANRSAIGEQYVDLRPPSANGPFLHDGSRIEGIVIPPVLQNVMSDVIALTESVPVDDLRTVVTELGKGFDGQSDNMARLADSLIALADTGAENIGHTVSLLRASDVVLSTQAEQSDTIEEWAQGVQKITAQLAASDPALRRTLGAAPGASSELSNLLRKHGAAGTALIHALGQTAHTIQPATYSTGMLVFMLSSLSAGSHSTNLGDGQIRFGLVLETENPPSCTRGYESTWAMIAEMKRKDPSFDPSYDDFPFNRDADCHVPVGNPTGVRSADRAALANPAYPQPWDSTPKKMPDTLNLNPLAQQLALLMGVAQK
ncbi:MCE family protein [Gordonia sp. (in: high G+C Gram-positive bacteria)]|uniref:MCE family protein n=1 Tax=Gordonia sp. (in: high G+C Gram-positive bacteria) TaxID=84139 RepID=UPI00352789B0